MTQDLLHAKMIIDKCKQEIKTVNALKEQVYEAELQMRQLKEQVASGKRDTLRWKTKAIKLEKEAKNLKSTLSREGSKPREMDDTSRPGRVLPIVSRSHSRGGIEDGRRSKTRGADHGELSASDDAEWGDEDLVEGDFGDSGGYRGSMHKASTRGKTAMAVMPRSGAVLASPTMNYSKVYERAFMSSTQVELPEDDNIDVRRIWSAQFASEEGEGGVHMGAGMDGTVDDVYDNRSLSAPPNRLDMTRSGSSLGIGNNAQLYLPPGPRGEYRQIQATTDANSTYFLIINTKLHEYARNSLRPCMCRNRWTENGPRQNVSGGSAGQRKEKIQEFQRAFLEFHMTMHVHKRSSDALGVRAMPKRT